MRKSRRTRERTANSVAGAAAAATLLSIMIACVPSPAGATEIAIDAVSSIGGTGTSESYILGFTGGLPVQGPGLSSSIEDLIGFWGWGDGLVSDVGSPIEGGPFETALRTVWPNPFAGQTTIGFAIGGHEGGAEGIPVSLQIFDVTGRVVAILVDQNLAPANYNATWNGRNRIGTRSPSGIYFVRLQAGSKTHSLRIIATK